MKRKDDSKKNVKGAQKTFQKKAVKPASPILTESARGKNSQKFVIALSIFSILGFLDVLLRSVFSLSLKDYMDFALMIILGIALLFDSDFKILRSLKQGLSQENFTHLIVAIIAGIAILSGVFSLPQLFIDHHMFLSIKGIVALIAIIVIIVQTWFTKN